MSPRMQHVGLAVLLVATLAVVALALRTPPVPDTSTRAGSSVSTTPPASPKPSASPSASSTTIGPGSTVVFLGDSFAAGTGASKPANRWTTLLSSQQQWKETNLAHAQTGYVQVGSAGSCTPETCPAFPDLVADVVAAKPALVVITGGANDLGRGNSKVADAVTRTITGIMKGVPGVKVAVVNPWWDLREEDPKLAVLSDAIKAAATGAGAVWVDTAQPLVGHPDLMDEDGYQANDKGQLALGGAVLAGLQKAGLVAK